MDYVDLQYFLNLELPFFEPKNIRRGGWSGVSRVETTGDHVYFVKRQVNHSYREPRRLFLKTPTLRREFHNFKRVQTAGLITPLIALYAEAKGDAMMAMEALTGYVDLSTYLNGDATDADRNTLFAHLIPSLISLHQHRYLHGCLYGKHIMVFCADPARIAFIDLEKLRWKPLRKRNAQRDIAQLLRHTEGLRDEETEQIIAAYESVYPGFRQGLKKRLHHKRSGIDHA